jgi:hypothetical protein
MDPEAVLYVDQYVRDAFLQFDKDSSGDIDASELNGALDACGLKGIDSSMIEFMLRKYDGDRNATLDIYEFSAMVDDLKMNSAESVKARLELRTNPVVTAALELWRNTAWHSMAVDSGLSEQEASTSATGLELNRTQYVLIVRKIVKALSAEWSDEEATQTAEEDWETDRRGHDTLSADYFMDGIFELADLCTH